MITYTPTSKDEIAVALDGKNIGFIRPSKEGGFHYKPKGSRIVGETFPSVAAVKESLEER